MQELEREERVALAARRGLGDGGVVERERLAQERVGLRGAERRDLEALAAELGERAIDQRRGRGIGEHGLGARRRDEEQAELRRVAVEREQAFERRRRGVVEIVHPQQDRPLLADALERAADDQPAQLGAIEGEALARRADDLAAERRGPDPLRRRGDPGLLFLVVGGDLPHVHQHLLDDVALGALEAVVLRDRSDDAVERRGDLPVARAERHHQRALVDLFAEPLGEATLADAGVAGEQDEAMAAVLGDLGRDLEQAAPLGVARDERARAKAEQAGRRHLRHVHPEGVGGRRRGVGGDDRPRPAERQRRRRRVARGRELAPRAARLGGELVAMPRSLRHEPHHELRDLGRHLLGEVGLGDRRALVLLQELFVGADVRLAIGEHREEDAPERVDVRRGPDVRRGEADLLRRHPPRRPRAPAHRRLGDLRSVEAMIDAVLHQPREAEVEHVHRGLAAAVGRDVDEHVGRLEIAVDHAARVRVRERAEDLVDGGPHDRPRDQAVGVGEVDPLVQRAPRDGIHRQVRRPVFERAEVARADDRRVREPRERARFFLKPPRVFGADLGAGADQELERDALVDHEIAAQVHDPHAAAPELATHLVAPREDGPRLVRLLRHVRAR